MSINLAVYVCLKLLSKINTNIYTYKLLIAPVDFLELCKYS